MKMQYFKALGNRFKKSVQPLNAAKNEVLSTWNSGSRWTWRRVSVLDQIYVLENLSWANHVDLVSIDTQDRQSEEVGQAISECHVRPRPMISLYFLIAFQKNVGWNYCIHCEIDREKIFIFKFFSKLSSVVIVEGKIWWFLQKCLR